MSDIIKQLQEDLAKAKKRQAIFHNFFTKVGSQDGKAISADERRWLNKLDDNIIKLENAITEQQYMLDNADLGDVINSYRSTKNVTNNYASQVNKTHVQWMQYIYSVGLDYNAAYNSFESILAAQKQYEADIADIAMSVVSIASLGTMSWISDSGKILKILNKNSDKIKTAIQVGEDTMQVFVDKVAGYQARNLPRASTPDAKTPFAFQTEILLKAMNSLLPILNIILEHEGYLVEYISNLGQLRLRPGGKERGSALIRREYEKSLRIKKIVLDSLAPVQSWIKTTPYSTLSGEARVDEFKRLFWKDWLPTLEHVTPAPIGRDGKPIGKDSVGHSNWWLSDEILEEWDRLLDLKKLGIGEGGLDHWVSDNDIRLLVLWARTHNTPLKF